MSIYLTRHFLSDHQRRQIAEQEAADFCCFGIVAFLIFCILLGAVFTGAGIL